MNVRQTRRNDGWHPRTGSQRTAPRTSFIRHVVKADIREPCAEFQRTVRRVQEQALSMFDGRVEWRAREWQPRVIGGDPLQKTSAGGVVRYDRSRLFRTQLAIARRGWRACLKSDRKYKIEGRGRLRAMSNMINGRASHLPRLR